MSTFPGAVHLGAVELTQDNSGQQDFEGEANVELASFKR